MHPKIGLKVIMMSREGLTVREIAEKTKLRHDEVEDYLIDHGEPVVYNQRQKRRENKISKIKADMDSMRVLGRPLNFKEVKTMESNKTRKGIALSDEIKAKAIELHEAGMTQAKIAEELSVGTASVYRILKAAKQTSEDLQDLPTAEEKEPAPVAAETSSKDWETLTVETAETPLTPITNNTTDKEFCQALIADIDEAMKMLMECALGEDVYSSAKAAYDIGGAMIRLQDAYSKLQEKVYEI